MSGPFLTLLWATWCAGQVVNGVQPRIEPQPAYPDPYISTWGETTRISLLSEVSVQSYGYPKADTRVHFYQWRRCPECLNIP